MILKKNHSDTEKIHAVKGKVSNTRKALQCGNFDTNASTIYNILRGSLSAGSASQKDLLLDNCTFSHCNIWKEYGSSTQEYFLFRNTVVTAISVMTTFIFVRECLNLQAVMLRCLFQIN